MCYKDFLIGIVFLFFSSTLLAQQVFPAGEKPLTDEEIKEGSTLTFLQGRLEEVLKPRVDLSNLMPVAGYQGTKKQSCWAFATAYVIRSVLDRNQTLKIGSETNFAKVYSPEYVYQYYSQQNNGCDFTANSQSMLRKILKDGIIKYSYLKYDPVNCIVPYNKELERKAKLSAMPDYEVVETKDLYTIKKILNENIPLVVSLNIDKYFETSGNITKAKPYWLSAGTPQKAHAMVIVGYDDPSKRVKVLNSWGTAWGDQGYVWIAYSIIESAKTFNYACYVVKKPLKILPVEEGSVPDEDNVSEQLTTNYLSSWVKQGYYREFDGYKIIVSKLSYSKKFIVVNIRDENDNLKYNFFIDERAIKEFYLGDKKYKFSLERIADAGRNFLKKAAYFTISLE